MSYFVEFHTPSGTLVSVNPAAVDLITQAGEGALVVVNGAKVDTIESYEEVVEAVSEALEVDEEDGLF